MKKSLFNRENIEKTVRLVPRPTMNGKLIVRSRNSWMILKDDDEGIEILNRQTNHGGKIPFDSMREWREPDMVILSAQLNLGKEGAFELTPFVDGHETEMITEEEEVLPERLAFVQDQLKKLTDNETKLLTELVIREKMTWGEIQQFCRSLGMVDTFEMHNFFAVMMNKISLMEKDDVNKIAFTARVKPTFVPILEKFLLPSQKNKAHASSSAIDKEHP
ncbi:MAG TPA: hypothetical protein VJ746_06040 [Nitrospira sp.]|nr:hypothetical protein [Nitrospira sp.]